MEHPLDTNDTEHAVALRRGLNSMREKRQSCDLVIKVGKEEVAVHRNVLMAQSDYFDAMFTHDTLENQTGVVEMKGVKFEPVKKCVDYFYTGKISTSEDGCEDLLYTASLMQAKPVCDKITPFLQSRLNPKSFFDIKKIATKFNLENLSNVCEEFALEKLDEIAKEDEFAELGVECLSQLVTLKKCSNSGDEDCKLAIVLQWIRSDPENRQSHLISLMKLCDLEKISLSYMKYLAENESLCYKSSQIMTLLLVAELDRQKLQAASAKMSFSLYPNTPNSILIVDVTSKHLQAYQPSTRSWTQLQPLEQGMMKSTGCTAVLLEEKLCVLMGDQKGYKFDIRDRSSQWIQMPDMLYEHGDYITAAKNDKHIYVTGNNYLERYSQEKNEWEQVDSKGICCSTSTLAEHKQSIYNIGGYRDGFLNTVKPVESNISLSTVAPSQVARQLPGVTVYDDKLFVAGGNNTNKGVEEYDPVSRSWKKISSMQKSRYYFSLIPIEESLYAVWDESGACTIEKYDVKSQQWTMEVNKPEMKIKAAASVAITVPE